MRLHRFYIQQNIGAQSEIMVESEELVNQISRVFRLKVGDKVILFDGSGNDYECTIMKFGESALVKVGAEKSMGVGANPHSGQKRSGKKVVTFHIEKTEQSRFMPEREVILCAALVKKDTFEWIIEKATELGVTKIIPILAERSEKKNLNQERLYKIAVEASEQSGRGDVPALGEIMSLGEAIGMAKSEGRPALRSPNVTSPTCVAFHLDGEQFRGLPSEGRPRLFVGPEGGWSPEELAMFHANKIPVVSLGKQVLKSETAVISALSLVMFGK